VNLSLDTGRDRRYAPFHLNDRTFPNDRESSSVAGIPDYELDDVRIVSSSDELRAMFHDLRSTLLELLHERAATVAELATAVARPKSTVAYHVGLLVDAGLLKVVRTRRVRAVEERCYGRTARIFYVGRIQPDQLPMITNYLTEAAAESVAAHEADNLRAFLRYVRIPDDRAEQFWRRVFEVVKEFSALPRSGDTVYGFVAGLYPTDHPSLPDPDPTG
jgi:DNA-binding transcriptional ArsR family regulator